MPVKIFYSWQDKTPPKSKYNRSFIRECIDEAVLKVIKELGLPSDYFVVASDLEDVPGWVNIPTTIEGRIREADIYIADLSFIAIIDGEGVPAPNVTGELYYAKGSIGEGRLITVSNTVYGPSTLLPFDLRQNRFGCQYEYDDTHPKPQARGKLVNCLSGAITTICTNELEREKAYVKPFMNWPKYHSAYHNRIAKTQ